MVEYRPQLNHPPNLFVEPSVERNFIRQGMTMSEFSNSYFDAKPTIRRIGQISHAFRNGRSRTADGLRYSSPWPWTFALAISLTLWASLAWLVWGR
jgi:hypothetical protein